MLRNGVIQWYQRFSTGWRGRDGNTAHCSTSTVIMFVSCKTPSAFALHGCPFYKEVVNFFLFGYSVCTPPLARYVDRPYKASETALRYPPPHTPYRLKNGFTYNSHAVKTWTIRRAGELWSGNWEAEEEKNKGLLSKAVEGGGSYKVYCSCNRVYNGHLTTMSLKFVYECFSLFRRKSGELRTQINVVIF